MTKLNDLVAGFTEDGTPVVLASGIDDLTNKVATIMFGTGPELSKQQIIDTAKACFAVGLLGISKHIVESHPEINFMMDDEHFAETRERIERNIPKGKEMLDALVASYRKPVVH